MTEMLTATFVVGCYQIHDTRTVNREQNVIEKHTTAWQHDGESEAATNNKRKATQGKNGFVKKKKRKKERASKKQPTWVREKEPGTWRGWGGRDIKHSGSLFDFNDATWDVAQDAVGIVCFYRGPG